MRACVGALVAPVQAMRDERAHHIRSAQLTCEKYGMLRAKLEGIWVHPSVVLLKLARSEVLMRVGAVLQQESESRRFQLRRVHGDMQKTMHPRTKRRCSVW